LHIRLRRRPRCAFPERNLEIEQGPAARRILKSDNAPVLGYNFGHDVEAQSRASFLPCAVALGLREFSENPGLEFLRNAGSVVANRD
jgi:hypothetical protein